MKRVVSALIVMIALVAMAVWAQQEVPPTGRDLDYLLTVIEKQEESIKMLQKEIEELRGKVAQLEANVTALSGGGKTGNRAVLPPSLEKWRHNLKRGMTYDQVRRVLGEPLEIYAAGTCYEKWYYSKHRSYAWVGFCSSRVDSWQEPKH